MVDYGVRKMSEKKRVEFVEKKPDLEKERISNETINILKPDGDKILRRFFG